MHVFLDLDGTLVDSAPAIIDSFARALHQHGLAPVTPLDRSLIGPPLRQTLTRITGVTDEARLDRVAATFKAIYDDEGIRATAGYPGLVGTLDALRGEGHRLYIVTNKRIHPTRRLLDHLSVADRFVETVTLDMQDPPHADKRASLGWVLGAHGVPPEEALMVGDSREDARAAWAHAVRLVAAAYGYGDAATQDEGPVAARLDALTDLPDVVRRLGA